MFDPKVVYLVTLHVDGVRRPEPRLFTGIAIEDPEHTTPRASHRLMFAEMADQARNGSMPITGEPERAPDGAIEVYDYTATLSTGLPTRRRFEPLTRENFKQLKPHVVGWDDLDTRLPTTEAIQLFYREEILGGG